MYSTKRCLYSVLAIVISLAWCGIAVSDTHHQGGIITGTEHWYSSGNTHYVEGDIYIEGSLTIHQDCYIEFDTGCKIEISDGGSLYIDGNAGHWVTMVGDNYALWDGITVGSFADISRFDVEYCSIWDAEQGIYVPGGYHNGDMNLTYCYVYGNSQYDVREGIYISDLDGYAYLTDCLVTHQRDSHGIYLQGILGVLEVNSCSVANAGQNASHHGIFTEACLNATLYDNHVSGCEGDGIHAWDIGNGNTDVSYNEIHNCERGIWRGRGHWDTDHNDIYNCEIGIYTDDYSQADVDYNDIYVPSGGKGIQVLNTNPSLYGNYITKYAGSYGAYGIYSGDAGPDPWVSSNVIERMNTGIYCGPNSGNSNTSFSLIPT